MVDSAYLLTLLLFILMDTPCFPTMDINIHSSTVRFRKCRKLGIFRTYQGITVQQCLEECQLRGYCNSINYNLLANYCQLVGNDLTANIESCTSYMSMDKPDWMQQLPTTLPPCPGYSRMDPTTGDCATIECAVPTLVNGFVNGNMVAVGRKIKFQCNDGYTPTVPVYSTCLESGEWSPSGPTCVLPIDGGWSGWTAQGACLSSCTATTSRTCDNPVPQNGGDPCSGPSTSSMCCRGGLCGVPSFSSC